MITNYFINADLFYSSWAMNLYGLLVTLRNVLHIVQYVIRLLTYIVANQIEGTKKRKMTKKYYVI